MKIDILTLFPEMMEGPLNQSILKRAQEKNLLSIKIWDLRKWTKDNHKTVDGKPFGGGAGMVMMIEVIDRALEELKTKESKVIFLTPQGQPFKQRKAQELSSAKHLIFLCGHYEGVDERVRENLVDEEISLGDFVLTGGEIPAMAVIDATARLLPGVLGNKDSIKDESFNKNRLEYPQYTRPADYKGWKVPKELLSGNHKEIDRWREESSLKRTKKVRPELLIND